MACICYLVKRLGQVNSHQVAAHHAFSGWSQFSHLAAFTSASVKIGFLD
jgi:hypothetical protein